METCEKCGKEYGVGAWPWCPHGIPDGMLGEFRPRWDEDIAPPPDKFGVRGMPEYDYQRGAYHIRSLADVQKLKRLNQSDYRGKKVGDPGCMV